MWMSGMIMLQGLFSLLLGYSRKKEKNLFIEWDEQEIRYLLLKDKSVQTIRVSEIKILYKMPLKSGLGWRNRRKFFFWKEFFTRI